MATKEGSAKTNLKPGIIYFSRLPPFMKPAKVRYIFGQYGEIGRLFLQPEDQMVRKRRKKYGGNKGKSFTEGWLEYKDKMVAKSVATTLNNTIVGGKKRNYYHDDIWNIKYLPKFKWSHLSEKIAYQKAVREQQMRTEISQAKREANYYLENVDRNKALKAIEKRRKNKNLGDINPLPNKKPRFERTIEMKTNIEIGSRNSKSKISQSLLKKIFTGGNA
ncbi:pre-rRNA-processing protein esf2-like [Xenia sp. Carnegie-2017]|uniref:pre-rRNA-processing protein esf2-like n=1 Tax=Xenia sp. Carnegie-2017 TaxID=2897299 RepID=UPI001F04394E|nr:pre-rRNA-processing protein esf2-like [Xenia sp. Carnegie-2017]